MENKIHKYAFASEVLGLLFVHCKAAPSVTMVPCGCWFPPSLTPAHAVPRMAEPANNQPELLPVGSPTPDIPHQTRGFREHQAPTGITHREPPGARGAAVQRTPTFPLREAADRNGSVRTLPWLGANTQLSCFPCPGNCGYSGKSINISQLPTARTSEQNSAFACELPAKSKPRT